jgi:hypothetical protein
LALKIFAVIAVRHELVVRKDAPVLADLHDPNLLVGSEESGRDTSSPDDQSNMTRRKSTAR